MTTRPVTVVTGASRGIGAATARLLAERGHDLVLGYLRDPDAAERVRADAEAAGVRAVTVRADVARDEELEALFAAATRLGGLTGLVNNAGLTAHIGDLADTPVGIVETVIAVNLLGAVLCARRAAQAMSTARGGAGGAIVNVSSAAATLGSPHEYVHYAAAKAGVDALTVGLAKELADQGVRVNGVAPGLVDTEIHAGAGRPDRPAQVVGRVPMARIGRTTEIAPAIAWLLGPESGYVTGTTVRVAGGL